MSKLVNKSSLFAAAVVAGLLATPSVALAEATPTPTTSQASNSCCAPTCNSTASHTNDGQSASKDANQSCGGK